MGSLITLRQIDLKRIIAYSSVAHMSVVMIGLFSYYFAGVKGAVYLMFAHGFASAALFLCIGSVYERHHSRLLAYYGGLSVVMPVLAASFFMFSIANMGFPGTANFVGEFLCIVGVYKQSILIAASTATSMILSAAFTTWLYNRFIFGGLKTTYIQKFIEVDRKEYLSLRGFCVIVLIMGLIDLYY